MEELPKRKIRRANKLEGISYKVETPLGTSFIILNHNSGFELIECFINIGRAGSDIQGFTESLARLINFLLTIDSSLTSHQKVLLIIKSLEGISGPRKVLHEGEMIGSLPSALARTLITHENYLVKKRKELIKTL